MKRIWPRALCAALIAASWACGKGDGELAAGPGKPPPGPCIDRDDDGRGEGCAQADCDDHDPKVFRGCLRCAVPSAGCECAAGTPPQACFLDSTTNDDGSQMCHEGTRFCRQGTWSDCEGVHSYVRPETVSQTALIDTAGAPARCNDCQVNCFRVTDNLDPVDGGLADDNSDGVDWVPGGGITLGRQDVDAGTANPDAGTVDPPDTCMPGTEPDIDCDGIPDEFDPFPDEPPFVTANPGIFLDIGPGQTGTGVIDLAFNLNAADVYFLIDQSGSMTDERDNLKAGLTSGDFIDDDAYRCADVNYNHVADDDGLKQQGIIGAVKCMIRDANFGVGFHREIPFPNYADNKHIAFDNYSDITADTSSVLAAVNRLDTIGNVDWPEASMLALHTLATGSGMYFGTTRRGVPPRVDCPAATWGYPCFREDAIPIVVLMTDAMMHNGPDTNAYAYSASNLGLTKGTTAAYYPVAATNETFTNAYDAGNVTDKLLTYTGDTTPMVSDIVRSQLSCLSTDGGADAVVKFTLNQQRTVSLSSEGTRFDTVLGLFSGQPQTPTTLPPSGNTNETAASADDLGTITGASVSIAGSTGAMGPHYEWSAVQCSAAPTAADAMYRFDVSATTLVDVSTDGSALDTVVALFSAAPATTPSFTPSANANDQLGSAQPMGGVYNAVRAYSGVTSALASNFSGGEVGCGADSASPDAVYSFTLAQPTRVRLSTEGSGFDTVIALVGDSCGSTPAMPPSSGASTGTRAQSGSNYTFAAGALVIPMGVADQDEGMLEAYGLVWELLRGDVPVSWVIRKNKTAGDPDFTIAAIDHVTAAAVASHGYKAGPFVVDAADVTAAAPIITAYRASHPDVVVHQTTGDLSAFVRRQLVAAPRFALMLDGGEDVARAYLAAAAIKDSADSASWPNSSPDTLTQSEIAGGAGAMDGALFDDQGTAEFCGVLSTGWPTLTAGLTGAGAIAEVRSLLSDTGSLIAQGVSVASFENNAQFITMAGYQAGSLPATLFAANADVPLAQIDGAFVSSSGTYPSFTLPAADDYRDNDAVLLRDESTSNGENDVWVAARLDGACSALTDTCEPGQARGMISYLGGASYATTMPVSTNTEANGVRLILNAMLAADCATELERPVPTISVSGSTATTNPNVTYQVTYTNDGDGVAYEARVVYTLPSGSTFVSATDGGALNGSEVVWSLGAMAPGEEDTFGVTVTLGAFGAYANQASVRYAQGLTERRVDSWIITTNYTSAPDLSCTALGINSQSVPSTNETQGLAYSVGATNGRIFALSGSTSGMAANYASSDLGTCTPNGSSPDAAFKFTLSQPANVTVDTADTAWDTVIGLYDGSVDPASVFTATNTNETTAAPQALGSVNGQRLVVSGGNTTSMVADYSASQITCGATPNASPDAVYSFTLASDTRVRVSTAGSSFDTIASVHNGVITAGNAPIDTTLSANTNEGFTLAPYVIPTAPTNNDQTYHGNTSSMTAHVDIADSCYDNRSFGEYFLGVDNTMADAVFRFTVPTGGGTYNIDTTGSSFNSVLAIYPGTPVTSDAPSTAITTTNSTLAAAYDLGTLDGYARRVSGNNSSFTSSFTTTSCGNVSSAKDAFVKFRLDSTRTVKFSTRNSSFDTVLYVYKTPSSYQGCNNDIGGFWDLETSEVTLSNLTSGEYYVVVTGDESGDHGAYELLVQDTSATDNQVACEDDPSGSTQAALTNLTLAAGDYYAVVKGRTSTAKGSYQLRIVDVNYSSGTTNLLECNDNYNSTQQSQVERDLTAGTYYAVVKGRSTSDQGTYALTIEDVNSPPVGSIVACNDDDGTLSTSEITQSLAAGDYWVVLKGKTAGAAGSYNLRITDTAASVGTVLECNDDGGESGSSIIERDLTPGTYYAVVKGDAATDHGAYNLSVRDVTNQGYHFLGCDADSGAGTASHLQQELAPGTYYLAVKGDTAATGAAYNLTVKDANNNPVGAIACDDDGGTYKTSKLSRTLAPGTYYAALKGYDASQEGRYQLTVGTAAASSGTYVPPTWAQTLAALQARDVRVVPILSCHDDPDHGDSLLGVGDCERTRAQAQTLASQTDALGVNLEPLVFDINRNGSGLSRAVVDGIASLAEYLEMDVQVVVEFDPDANPGFTVAISAVDDPFDGCSGLIGTEHQNCVPGATPRFNIAFTNPLPGVPLNEDDPNGGYTFRAKLVADDRFVVEEIPIYIIPEQLDEEDPPVPPYNEEAEYWQDTGAPGCSGMTEAPDWRDLSWDADVYPGTTITFLACTSQTPEGLDSCIPKEIASVTGVGACTSDADCDLGFCDAESGACQVATTGTCTSDVECGANAFCDLTGTGKCTYESQPVYIGVVLAEQNFQSYLRMKIEMTGTPPIDDPPVLHRWEMTYLCQNQL